MITGISRFDGYTLSADKILINTVIGNTDGSSGFQFVMQYFNSESYIIVVGQAMNDDFTKFRRIAGLTLNIFYI